MCLIMGQHLLFTRKSKKINARKAEIFAAKNILKQDEKFVIKNKLNSVKLYLNSLIKTSLYVEKRTDKIFMRRFYYGTHSFVIFAQHGELWRFVAPPY